MTRIRAAAALQFLGWPYRLGWPWLILSISFLANLPVYAAIGSELPAGAITGGVSSVFIVEMIFCGQTITQIFPFAVNLSMTRRSFYVATILTLLARALGFGLMLLILKLVEDATNGWGIAMHFFGMRGLAQSNPALQLLTYTMLFIVLDLCAVLAALTHARWRLNGVLVLIASTGLLAAGLSAMLTWYRWWDDLFGWFADQPTLLLLAGWPVALAVLLAGGGFLTIRRATPA